MTASQHTATASSLRPSLLCSGIARQPAGCNRRVRTAIERGGGTASTRASGCRPFRAVLVVPSCLLVAWRAAVGHCRGGGHLGADVVCGGGDAWCCRRRYRMRPCCAAGGVASPSAKWSPGCRRLRRRRAGMRRLGGGCPCRCGGGTGAIVAAAACGLVARRAVSRHRRGGGRLTVGVCGGGVRACDGWAAGALAGVGGGPVQSSPQPHAALLRGGRCRVTAAVEVAWLSAFAAAA